MASSIPSSRSTVIVYIISPNQVLGVPPSAFLASNIEGTTYSDTLCLCFLIEHTDSAGRVSRPLFDLGIRKDLENFPPSVVEAVRSMDIEVRTTQDVADLLASNGIEPKSIDRIVLSHWHFDHVGDLNRFPSSTGVVVGPGFKQSCLPGYPEHQDSILDHEAFRNRRVEEANFADPGFQIAGLQAIDCFGDGSFYLLNTPGHAVGHMTALARTTAEGVEGDDTFILLAGDVCHHAGELRPNSFRPLPPEIPTDGSASYKPSADYCNIHPHRCISRPFYSPSAGGFNLDPEVMKDTVEKIAVLDSDPNVFVVLGHDHWLLNVIQLFPKPANECKSRKRKEDTMWRFLLDFA